MKISIVTISYNQAQFLERAILSVLNQNYPELEYIIVDPGSTDGSREIIEKYRDKFAHVVLEKDNGPADGLNKGFALATGDIYGFLNSDDMLLPDSLKNIDNYFLCNYAVDVVSGHALVVDKDDSIKRKVYSDLFNITASAYSSCILIQPSTFFTSHIFKKTRGFNICNKISWDAELFDDFYLSGAKFSLVNKFFSCYRVHEDSITCSEELANQRQKNSEKRYEKCLQLPSSRRSKYLYTYYKYRRKILNYRDTLERLKYGSVGSAWK